MSSSRRRSTDAVTFDTSRPRAGSSSDGGSLERGASYRSSRRSSTGTGGNLARVTISRSANSSGRSGSQRSSRVRRPTPVVRRSRVIENPPPSPVSDTESDTTTNQDERQVEPKRSSRRSRRLDVNLTTRRSGNPSPNRAARQLSWYERLMPECLLTMSAPITGYETRLDSDVDDDEYEVLERQRLKRNRRVRRRLLTLILVAALASAFFYSRGRVMRRTGIRAAASTLRNRIEDGLSKTIQDTVGK